MNASSGREAWLQRLWGGVCAHLEGAPADWAEWARRQVRVGPGEALWRAHGWSLRPSSLGTSWAGVRGAAEREALGQVFTPAPLAELVARLSGAGTEEDAWPEPTVLDPACGAGSLLLAVVRARLAAGWDVSRALEAVEGWDRDPVAAWSCRALLVDLALSRAAGDPPGDLRVHVVDALSTTGRPGRLLRREPPFPRGVGAVVANPPYLESKRMGRAEPGLKERLKRQFPELTGAFDLYLAFCWRILQQVGDGGSAVLLLPNKVLQGRYAATFRERILQDGAPALASLVDLARLQPRPFPGTGVYPAVLHLRQAPGEKPARAHRVLLPDDLDTPTERYAPLEARALRRVGGEHPLFVPFSETWPDLEPLFALPRLGGIAELATTCIFHVKGLRERFVTPQRPDAFAHPYLGGPSRARRTEVAPFRIRWSGWWIRYDQEALRREHRNPLPDLERVFLRPKIIFCQHGLRMRAVMDPDGRWVTKDVYPVAWPSRPDLSLEQLLALLSSTVFTALYNTLYQGVVCGGETYHYLPAFLRGVPVPRELPDVGREVRALSEGPDPDVWERLDQRLAEAYGVSERARRAMVEVHLRRVGAETPGR